MKTITNNMKKLKINDIKNNSQNNNENISNLCNKLKTIKIKIVKQKYVAFIPIFKSNLNVNNRDNSISLQPYLIYLNNNRTFEIYNKTNISKNTILDIISIFNLDFKNIIKIKKIKEHNNLIIHLIFIKKRSYLLNSNTEKWHKFFKFGNEISNNSIKITEPKLNYEIFLNKILI